MKPTAKELNWELNNNKKYSKFNLVELINNAVDIYGDTIIFGCEALIKEKFKNEIKEGKVVIKKFIGPKARLLGYDFYFISWE